METQNIKDKTKGSVRQKQETEMFPFFKCKTVCFVVVAAVFLVFVCFKVGETDSSLYISFSVPRNT